MRILAHLIRWYGISCCAGAGLFALSVWMFVACVPTPPAAPFESAADMTYPLVSGLCAFIGVLPVLRAVVGTALSRAAMAAVEGDTTVR